MRLHYTSKINDESEQLDYLVRVAWVPCNYRGYRPYFVCPRCQHRRITLYLAPWNSRFACRTRYNLTCQSCSESHNLHCHARRRTQKVAHELRLSDFDKVAGVYFSVDRPRYMHVRTFERMKRNLARLEYEEARRYDFVSSRYVEVAILNVSVTTFPCHTVLYIRT